jgi:FAD/FMN-containing dehydrogenase
MTLFEELQTVLEGEVYTDASSLEKASEDTSIFKIYPTCVVCPKHTKDVAALVKFAHKHAGVMSLTARAAGTDMSGGPLTSSVVVSMTEHFNKVVAVNHTQAVVEPGVYYRDFDKETLKYGVILPSYTASRELNTVGGMVANNSAGEKSLTYGKTERWVRALKVVLSDGNEYVFKKLSRTELEEKKTQRDFEGSLYRNLERLILENKDCIQKEKPQVAKNSAGYSIWNVWDAKKDSFDLTQLLTGSQGTLGVITEITFDLVKPNKHSRMLVIFLRAKQMKELGAIINTVLEHKPESFESYDDKTFNVMLRVFPKLFMRLGGNPFRLARDFFPEIKMVLTGGIPKLVLMAEFSGTTEEEAATQALRAQAAIKGQYDVATHVTRSEKEGNKFWIIRRESFKLLRENVHGKHTAPFIDDLSVRPEHLPEFLPKLYSILDEYDLIYTVAGHVGDGNFHIIPLMDFGRPDFAHIVQELSERVYTLVGEYNGSITGEHNDGLIRTPYLHKMFSPDMLILFESIKNIFDPLNIFNPHKKVHGTMNVLLHSIKKQVND